MRQLRVAVVALVLNGTAVPACVAQTEESAPDIGRELATLNATMKEIAQLLRHQAEAQDLDLMMKRLEFAEGQISETERRLSRAQEELRSVEGEIGGLESRRQLPEEVERSGGGMDPAEAEAIAAEAESQLRAVRKRIGDLTNEIAELETRLSEQREQARGWRSALDRRLASR